MSALKNAEQEKKDAKKAANGASKRVQSGNSTSTADWATADPRWLAACIAIVAGQGGALRFGYTSDGGAYAVGVYGDGDKPYTDYIRPHEDIDDYLRSLYAAWGGGG